MSLSEAGRALAAARPTVETACAVCGAVNRQRARKSRDGEPLEPMASYCSARCRAKAAYARRKRERGAVE